MSTSAVSETREGVLLLCFLLHFAQMLANVYKRLLFCTFASLLFSLLKKEAPLLIFFEVT